MRTLDVSSKEAYLQWVKEWKEVYKKVSQELRKLRLELSHPHKVDLIDNGWGKYYVSHAAGAQSRQAMLQGTAQTLLYERHRGKELSWQEKQKKTEIVKSADSVGQELNITEEVVQHEIVSNSFKVVGQMAKRILGLKD